MKKYVVGVDFGTLSVRAIVVRIADGGTVAQSVWTYPHGVMDRALPDGTALNGPGWALADPDDYRQGLTETVREAVRRSGVPPEEIGALAIASTACTLIPVNSDLTPLCAFERFRSRPHAWCKLWKHHRPQKYADRMTEVAQRGGWTFLDNYGGRISPEGALPKAMEVYHEDREVYAEADRMMQLSDWLTALLVGDPEVQNGSIAAYKALRDIRNGYPSEEYLACLGPEASDIIRRKLRGRSLLAGECAGTLTPSWAATLGLCEDVRVGMAHTDAHSAAYGVGVAGEGDYVFIVGTSSCGHLLSKKQVIVPGATGSVADSLMRGYYGYSAGQACVGDMLDWFVYNCLPGEWAQRAEREGLNVYQLLEQEAAVIAPGANGLLALDWFNGNRSILSNANLTGLLIGMTTRTTPVEIFRALLESIAFGFREIIDNYFQQGLSINEIVLCGGIAQKNKLLSRIMADVVNRPISISSEAQATALGAAICAAATLGEKEGGYASLPDAIVAMHAHIAERIIPDSARAKEYENRYALYHRLYHYFGGEARDIMEALRA